VLLFTFWGCSNTDSLVDPSSDNSITNPGKSDGETDYVSPYRRYRICGTVFDDEDHDGVQTGAEAGLPNVTVNLSGNGSTTTDANGNYCFWAYPGTYDVDAETFDPYNWSTTDNPLEVILGNAHVYDADIGLSTRNPNLVLPDDGDWDICGTVYKDCRPVRGADVELWYNDQCWTTQTNDCGEYCFDGFIDGDYVVKAEKWYWFFIWFRCHDQINVTVNGADVNDADLNLHL
jgi:hypothetical protein